MITVQNLTKRYAGGVTALDNISFIIEDGVICGYIGTNGAGKSTTVKILTGMLDFDSGMASVNGIDVRKDPFEVKKIVGYVPETANLFNALSIVEYLKFIGTVRDMDHQLIKKRTNNFSEIFALSTMLDDSIGSLSKGNKQKVLITSALLHNPDVIFFDEPLNGLDANSIFVFHDLMSFLSRSGRTILYCSHLLNTVEKVSSKIILLDKGKVVIDTSTEDLKNTENYSGLEDLFRNLRDEDEIKKISYEGLFD